MKRTSFFIVFLAIFCVITQAVLGQTFSIQGVLRDPLGRTVTDGAYAMTFKIYEQASGGAAIWTETLGSVDVKHGVFIVELGTVTSMSGLTFDTQYYIGIAVESGQELEPRMKLSNSPTAMAVLGVDNSFPSSGNVGVGTADPQAGLDIITQNANDDLLKITSSGGENRNVRVDKEGNLIIDSGSVIKFASDGTSLASADFGGAATAVTTPGDANITADALNSGSGNINFKIAETTVATIAHDGNTSFTGDVSAAGRVKDVTGYLAPVGTITMFAGSAAPDGWLICDGSSVSATTYADLYSVIGTTYGGSSSNFYLPNLKGRVPVARDPADASFNAVGNHGGEKTHALTANEMPSHMHTVDPPSTYTNTTGNHSHTYTQPSAMSNGDQQGIPDYVSVTTGTTSAAGDHYHSVDIGAFYSGSTGSGAAHNILQPFFVLNFIIKY